MIGARIVLSRARGLYDGTASGGLPRSLNEVARAGAEIIPNAGDPRSKVFDHRQIPKPLPAAKSMRRVPATSLREPNCTTRATTNRAMLLILLSSSRRIEKYDFPISRGFELWLLANSCSRFWSAQRAAAKLS